MKLEGGLCSGGPSYIVGKAQKIDHTDDEVLGSNNMKKVAKILGKVVKVGIYRRVCCSALKVSLWYRASAFKEKEKRDSAGKHLGEDRSESKEIESLAMQLMFEMDNSGLHYTCAVQIYQQILTVKHATQTPVLQVVIHFWPPRVSQRAVRSGKLRRLQKECYEPPAVNKRDEQYSMCAFSGMSLKLGDRRFGKEDTSEAGA